MIWVIQRIAVILIPHALTVGVDARGTITVAVCTDFYSLIIYVAAVL